MIRVLIVDDDVFIRKLITLYLRKEGYHIVAAGDGEDALGVLGREKVHLVILDIMMPKIDGWKLCQDIRRFGNLPILTVIAKGQNDDRISELELGPDDYLVKPFDPIELVDRVKVLLKRYQVALEQVIQLGDLYLDVRNYQLRIQDHSVRIPTKEFELLYQLASYPGQVFTRAHLIEQIWGYDYPGDERTVDVHIKRLRQKLKEFSQQVEIVTVRGLGYRIEVK